MISIGTYLVKGEHYVLEHQNVAEVMEVLENSSLPGLPVVDKDHKLLGLVFKEDLEGVYGDTPLVKY